MLRICTSVICKLLILEDKLPFVIYNNMEEKEITSVNKHTKVLIPASSYDFKTDKRLLIPFTSGENIGFVNRDGEVVAKPQFAMYYGECYNTTDYIRVVKAVPYGYPRGGNKVAAYKRTVWGLINYKGEELLPFEYARIVPSLTNISIFTVQKMDGPYAVFTIKGEEIVPFGKYDWIDGFDHGLARVKVGTESITYNDHKSKMGLINEYGDEVLPVEYDNIWNFYDKKRPDTRIEKEGCSRNIRFDELNNVPENDCDFIENDVDDDYGTHYGEFAGSYAQDVAGYSDDVINDAFEGDPDAYWNID